MPVAPLIMARRRVLTLAAGALALPVTACDRKTQWHETGVSGSLPPLSFAMAGVMTGGEVTAADFRGKVTLL